MVHHSDRGSVYASADYGDALTKLGGVKSMSPKGDCWDNAVAGASSPPSRARGSTTRTDLLKVATDALGRENLSIHEL